MNIMSRLRIKKSLITVVLHSSNVFAIAKTRHQQMDSGCIFVDEVSAPHMCKSTLFNNYSFYIVCFLWRTAAFCLLLLYRNKMQHHAFRLYLFAAAALLRRCFSASAPKTALVLFKRQKGYRFNRCP